MTGYQEEILSSVTVPLADQETTGTLSTDTDMETTLSLSMPAQL